MQSIEKKNLSDEDDQIIKIPLSISVFFIIEAILWMIFIVNTVWVFVNEAGDNNIGFGYFITFMAVIFVISVTAVYTEREVHKQIEYGIKNDKPYFDGLMSYKYLIVSFIFSLFFLTVIIIEILYSQYESREYLIRLGFFAIPFFVYRFYKDFSSRLRE